MSDIGSLRTSALASVEAATSTAELEELRVQLLGKKGGSQASKDEPEAVAEAEA